MERINQKRVKYLSALIIFNGDLFEAHAAILQVCENEIKKECTKSTAVRLGKICFFLLTLTIHQCL